MATIEVISVKDAKDILRIYAPIVETSHATYELEVPSEQEMANRISAVLQAGKPWIVCRYKGEVIGYSYANTYRTRPAYNWLLER